MQLTIQRVEADEQGAFVIENDPGTRPPYLAEMTYQWQEGVMVIVHTGVRAPLRGQGVAGRLVASAVAAARAEGFAILPLCPYAKAVFDGDPDLNDVRLGSDG